ncbi:MAG: sulfite exporter TauE/SafE family protein [Thermoleophilaceae bacterium]|nr:sulfite exporter TauE/SafE family protein [Thermoleophilaceae bacterium]
MDPLIAVFGLCVGLLVGLTGVGGGSLMTPLLIIVFGIKPVTAVGTDLTYAAVTKTVGGLKHFRQRTVDLGVSTWMAVGSVPAAVGGVYALHALERAHGRAIDDLLLTVLAAALLITGTATLVRALFLQRLVSAEREAVPMERRDKVAAVLVGLFVGFMLGVTSAGSGALIAVALILLFRLVPTRVVGTDVFHAAILLWAAAAAHIVAGNVDFGLAGTILIGSVPGVWVGSHMSVRIPVGTLRTALAIVLLGSGLGLLSKAGAGVPTLVLAAVPVSLVVLIGGQALVRRSRRLRREAEEEDAASAGGRKPSPYFTGA